MQLVIVLSPQDIRWVTKYCGGSKDKDKLEALTTGAVETIVTWKSNSIEDTIIFSSIRPYIFIPLTRG